MRTFLIAVMLAVASLSAGCASVVRSISDEALERAQPEQRAEYRKILGEATNAYDSRYELNGMPKKAEPETTK